MRAEATGMTWRSPGDPRNLGTIGGEVYPLIASTDLRVGDPVIVDSGMMAGFSGGSNGATGVCVGGRQTKFNCCMSPGDVGVPAASAGELALICVLGVVYTGSSPFDAQRRFIVPKPSDLLGGQEIIATGIGDGNADNVASFTAITETVNNIAGKAPVVLKLAPGHYKYSGGFIFTREVILDMEGVYLDYIGTNIPGKFGPDDLTVLDNYSHRRYGMRKVTLTGGAGMTQGWFVNSYVTVPVFDEVWFIEYGNATAWGIWFQSDNWDIQIRDPQWLTRSDSTGNRNWIRVNGIRKDGTPDQGQSRLTMWGGQALEQGFGQGVGLYVNGVASLVHSINFSGFGPAVQLGPYSFRTRLHHMYFEVTKTGTEAIRYGDDTGIYAGTFSQFLNIEDCFANLHNSYTDNPDPYNTSASFLGNASPTSGLQYTRLYRNNVVQLDPTRPLVRQALTASQIDNRASGNTGHGLLHTAGVADWTDLDEKFSPNALNNDSGGLKSGRKFGGITVLAGATTNFVFPWLTPFPDLNYTYSCEVYDAGSFNSDVILDVDARVISWDGTGITVRVRNRSVHDFIGGIGVIATKDG